MEIYDRLLQFPLFQGMSHNELMQVVTHTKIGFTKSAAGKRIVREGDDCTHLYFLISGTLTAETAADDRGITATELDNAEMSLSSAKATLNSAVAAVEQAKSAVR